MDIFEKEALTLSSDIESGALSAAELMQATLARIDAVNGDVNAVVSLRDGDDLMAEARAADNAPRKGWLHGIPMAIKDLTNAKGLPTSMGSPIFEGTIAEEDDLMVARLRAAGALIIGKTNTPEFGLGSHTFNPVHGATRNPYDLAKSSGGSSGGAAAALAARMVSVADGSDMMGSLRNPAGWNNVYGMLPTWGRVLNQGAGDVFVHPMASSGPMARCPADLAALGDTMSGPDSRQPLSRAPDATLPFLNADLRRQRIGDLGNWGGALPYEIGIADLTDEALREMETLGHIVEPVDAPFDMDRMWDSWITLRFFAKAAGLHPLHADLAKRAQLNRNTVWEIENGLSLSAMDVHHASIARSDWFRALHDLFGRFDVLVLPSAQCWPFDVDLAHPTEIAGVAMDTYHRWMQVVIPASLLGLPVVNIPVGFGDNGLPGGVQLIGPHGSDARLLQLAQDWHKMTDWPNKRPPTL